MRLAEARLNASIMTRSSIRWSLTGGQVGWITKTSWPRTFSLIWTYTSPSEKRETSASPSRTCRYWAISSASGRFAFPENSFSSYAMALTQHSPHRESTQPSPPGFPLLLEVPRLWLVRHVSARTASVPAHDGWGGRDRPSVAGSKAPSPTSGRRPMASHFHARTARMHAPLFVLTAQADQPARFTRRWI